ncbi:DUF3048 domain-containing protein [Streptomyces sp. NBC_01481]|uniref:DUF3048 domain-containing protein n=1 Tax=Streptomyces sp. NBC_01481 TaxID=2975869 RepID=UPI00225BC465|nr:DUF3048 domain-containing protein [Streptomyces sp. NBC_01481]MCX4587254.1 DUF3048 domain-containing protein [Streptomyces sp. NBC_01481]
MPAKTKKRSAAAVAMLFVTLALAASGCEGGDGSNPPARDRTPSTSASVPPAHVLAVKIDNVAPARPPTGLDKADIVYVERVEAGLSRILAVFSSQLPPVVGPVRSARESDLELLRQFDRPTLAFSGAQSKLLPVIEAAPVNAVPPGKAPGGAYFRSQDRAAPHNLYLRPARVLRDTSGVNAATYAGFTFGAEPPGGKPTAAYTVRYPAARFAFTWSPQRAQWLVAMDGTPSRTQAGQQLGAATVVVQYVSVRPSKFHDRSGNISPYTETVGSGTALVLRDSKAHKAEWKRPTTESGTTFTTPDGRPMAFAPGQVWIVYAAR